jgi:hypothetical protein
MGGANMNVYRNFSWIPEGRKLLEWLIWGNNIKMDLKIYVVGIWTGFVWIRIESSSRLL